MSEVNVISSRESRIRSLAKGLTWRIVATVTTIIIALAITENIDAALKIGGVEVFAKLLVYYVHERLWNRFQTI